MQHAAARVEPVAGRKLGDVIAQPRDCLHLRRHPQPAFDIVAPVQRADADVVAGDDRALLPRIPQHEGEHAVEPVEPRAGIALGIAGMQRVDHLAIGAALEGVGVLKIRAQFAVVVDLAVDRERQLPVAGEQRLRAASGIDDGQSLVHQQRMGMLVHAAPIGPAMALPCGQREREWPQHGEIAAGTEVDDGKDGTHGRTPCRGDAAWWSETKKPALEGGLQEGWRGEDALTAGPREAGVIAVIGVGDHACRHRRDVGGEGVGRGARVHHGPSVHPRADEAQSRAGTFSASAASHAGQPRNPDGQPRSTRRNRLRGPDA